MGKNPTKDTQKCQLLHNGDMNAEEGMDMDTSSSYASSFLTPWIFFYGTSVL